MSRRPRNFSEFATEHDLLEAFVPFESHPFDPLDVVGFINDRIEEKPQTAAHIYQSTLFDAFEDAQTALARLSDTYFLAAGAWRANLNKADVRNRYVNPEYVHARSHASITAREQREAMLQRLASMGIHTRDVAATMFGVKEASVNRYITRWGVSWSSTRTAGTRRMARTWAVMNRWHGTPYSEIAEAFGVPEGTVTSSISRHVDFDSLPANPAGRRGWRPTMPSAARKYGGGVA